MKEKIHYLRFPAVLFKGNNGECKWSQIKENRTQSCFLALASLMSGKWGWKTKANVNTITRMTGITNKTRVRESLAKLEKLNFINRYNGYYALDKSLRVKEIPLSDREIRFNQAYYLIEPETFGDLTNNCTKNEQTVFLFLAVKGSMDDDPGNDFYRTFNKRRGKRYWELLGMSKRSWYKSLESLKTKGWIAIGEKREEIYILIGRKPEKTMRMQISPATEKLRQEKRKTGFYNPRPKLFYMLSDEEREEEMRKLREEIRKRDRNRHIREIVQKR